MSSCYTGCPGKKHFLNSSEFYSHYCVSLNTINYSYIVINAEYAYLKGRNKQQRKGCEGRECGIYVSEFALNSQSKFLIFRA